MRRFLFVAAWLAICSSVAPCQATSELKHLTVAVLNMDWPSTLTAQSIERSGGYPAVVSLKGNVEIKTPVCIRVEPGKTLTCDGYTILRSDEATFHEDTGKIEASGNVRVTPRETERTSK